MKSAQIREGICALWSEEDAVTSIEYALLGALIVVAIVVSVGILGDSVKALYEDVAAKVLAAVT